MLALVGDQGEVVPQAEPFHYLQKVAQVRRPLQRTGSAGGVNTHLGLEPIDEQHVPTEPLEPEEILQENPSVPTVSRFLG
jgi:hypothetical protein